MKLQVFIFILLLLGSLLSAGTISGQIQVTGSEPVLCDLYLTNTWQSHQLVNFQEVLSGGTYTFTDLEAGTYLLQIIPQDMHYLPEYYLDAPSAMQATLLVLESAQQSLEDIDLLLDYHSAVVSGSISGTVSASGSAVSNHIVYLYGTDQNPEYACIGITGPDGSFSFSALYPGSYILFVDHYPGYRHYFWENAASFMQADVITVTAGEYLDNFEIMLEPLPSYSISGTVYETQEGVNFPLASALVSGYALNCWGEGEYFQEITDEYGHYSTEISGGLYWLFSHKEGYSDLYWPQAASLETAQPLQINQDLNDIDFVMDPLIDPSSNSISGFITNEGQEPGFPCMVIVIASDEDDEWSESTISESSGYYYIDEIPSGDYYVVMLTSSTPPLYYPEEYNWEDADEIFIEGNITDINFDIDQINSNGIYLMEGVITTPGRIPVAGASVVFFDDNNHPASFSITNAEGLWSAGFLPAGQYTAQAAKTFYNTESTQLEIINDGELNFELNPAVTALDESQLPCPVNSITCYPNPYSINSHRAGIKINFTPYLTAPGNISVYNLRGQLLENIHTGMLSSQPQSIYWNPLDKHFSASVYLISLTQEGVKRQTQKLLLLK